MSRFPFGIPVFDAITVPEPPCTGCSLAPTCSRLLLACLAYQLYVKGKRWSPAQRQLPTAELYDHPHPEETTLKLTNTRCRCSGCGEYFNRTSTFARHRVGPFAPIHQPDSRRCLTPEQMQAKGWSRNAGGWWVTGAKHHASQLVHRVPVDKRTSRLPASAGAAIDPTASPTAPQPAAANTSTRSPAGEVSHA